MLSFIVGIFTQMFDKTSPKIYEPEKRVRHPME